MFSHAFKGSISWKYVRTEFISVLDFQIDILVFFKKNFELTIYHYYCEILPLKYESL